jgi:hypothetical protein
MCGRGFDAADIGARLVACSRDQPLLAWIALVPREPVFSGDVIEDRHAREPYATPGDPPDRRRNAGGGAITLIERHRMMLASSAISDAVISARGYFSAETKTQLGDLGFARPQQIVPALVLPQHSVDGTVVNYQSRPDRPRIDPEKGREIKYESVAGANGVRLDVPPRCRQFLARPIKLLWVTEGLKKGDALASHGLCAVALLGVWSWRTDDWDRIALDERDVYVVFDTT